ncbi:MAG: S8 family serine peptidase [Acholeplasmataceae bacterium]|nr:S8 family serine peptidase [Acholeplasmataceae bacterium]
MKTKLMRVTYILILFSFISISFFSFIQNDDSKATLFYNEVLYHLEFDEEATQLADAYEIALLDVSPYGIAKFAVNNIETLNTLLDSGFSLNSIYYVEGRPSANPFNDPYYSEQYALDMMEMELAWQFTDGGADVVIAIIDSGIDIDHPEFIGRISPLSYNSRTDQVGINYVIDDAGHGTSVTGVIGAIKNNNTGVAGLVQNSTLLIIKANNLDNPATIGEDEDESRTFSDDSIINGIYYAVENGADVINMSLGGPDSSTEMQDAVTYARDHGVIVVAAAGNDGTNDLFYPASYDGVISVAAVDEDRTSASYSNYNLDIDIAAPGTSIITTQMDNQYGYSSGTSLAAPQVTGVLALLLAYYPDASDQQIIDRLQNGAVDEGLEGKDIYFGYGIVNAKNSILLDLQDATVSFETNGGTIIDPITVYIGETINIEDPQKEGHNFVGWYSDPLFQNIFDLELNIVTGTMTLYAKFDPILYTVHFISDGSEVADIQVPYGQTFELPISSLYGFELIDWYLDSDYQQVYIESPITGDLTLYAYFEELYFSVTTYVNGDIDDVIQVQEGQMFTLVDPIDINRDFLGWYLEPDLINIYVSSPIEQNLILYAKFDEIKYRVKYYDSDLITVIQESRVYINQSVLPPLEPIKSSTTSFEYIFTNWSHNSNNVISDMDIYPVYQKIYKPDSIALSPGIDTIELGNEWIDEGVNAIDSLITVVTRSSVDIETIGVYTVYYDIYDNDFLLDTLVRIVHIIELKESVEIVLNPDITTIYEGYPYVDAGATSDRGVIEVSGLVDANQAGVYVITYTVQVGDQIFTKEKYIYVIESVETSISPAVYNKKDEEVWVI